jgi:predicted membrane-bound spermidine synthase
MPDGHVTRQIDRGIGMHGEFKMKHERTHIPNLSYIAAFVIGVILFASIWKTWFGLASSTVVLTGMAGAAVAVTAFWLRNENQNRNNKEK